MNSSVQVVCDQPRILIVEDETDLRSLYSDLLSYWGYQPYIVEGEGRDLLRNAVIAAQDFRCHLALVDLRLIDNDDKRDLSGMELMHDLKPTKSIILSGKIDISLARELQEKGAVSFLRKEEGPEPLKKVLENETQKYCVCQHELNILPMGIVNEIRDGIYFDDPTVPEDEVADLLARLFPSAKQLFIEFIEGSDQRRFTQVPRPRSCVLLVHPDNLHPKVVKMARSRKIKKEINRYQDYIDGYIVGHFSPPPKNWNTLWDIGGVVYPLLGASTVKPFANYYRDNSVGDIKHSLERFFDHTWTRLYRDALVSNTVSDNIFDAYCSVWEYKWYQERVDTFHKIDPFAVMPSQYNNLDIPDPVAWLKNRINGGYNIPSTKMAITHGDLHGDNILVDDSRDIWAVDFERSGPGPILQDFVELENDIINRLTGLLEDDFHSLYILGVWVAKDKNLGEVPEQPSTIEPDLKKTMDIIAYIRYLARKCTKDIDANTYIWGLLLNSVFRATMLTREGQENFQQRALMFGSIMCHRLDHWEEAWPPESWPSIYDERG